MNKQIGRQTALLSRSSEQLRIGNRLLSFPYKTWRVVERLTTSAPNIVRREELIEEIWEGNYYVGEKALNQALWLVRRALGDNAKQPEWIKTVPG